MNWIVQILVVVFFLANSGCVFLKKARCKKLSEEHAQLMVGKNPYVPKGKNYKKYKKKNRGNECTFRTKHWHK